MDRRPIRLLRFRKRKTEPPPPAALVLIARIVVAVMAVGFAAGGIFVAYIGWNGEGSGIMLVGIVITVAAILFLWSAVTDRAREVFDTAVSLVLALIFQK